MLCFFMGLCKIRCVTVTLYVFSILFMVFAAATIYLTTRLSDSQVWQLQSNPESDLDENQAKMQTIMDIVYYGIIAGSAFTILVGCLGILTGRYKTCCTIGLFSFFSFLMSLMLLAVGVLILLVTIASG